MIKRWRFDARSSVFLLFFSTRVFQFHAFKGVSLGRRRGPEDMRQRKLLKYKKYTNLADSVCLRLES